MMTIGGKYVGRRGVSNIFGFMWFGNILPGVGFVNSIEDLKNEQFNTVD